MNSPTTGALLARDKIDRYRSYGAFGKPAYQSYVQMRAMLRSKKGDWLANYFAKPTYDPDTNELRWTAEVPGPVRSLQQLQGEEFQRGVEALDGIHRKLQEFAQELRQQGQAAGNAAQPGGAAAFASLLEQAMKVPPSGDFLFFVGEQPVIAFWGFTDPDGRSVDPALLAPRMAAAAEAAPVEPVAALPVQEKRKRPWWWWLLWLLLALLLIALLLLLPRACVPGGGLDLKRAIPGLAPPDGAASEPPAMPRSEGPGAPALPGGPGPEGAAPPNQPPGAEPPLPGASQPDLALPPDAKDPKTEPPPPPEAKEPPPPEGKDPKTEPPLPPETKDDPAKPPKDPKDPKNAKPRTDPPVPPNPKDMKMPDDPNAQKKMDFLEGQWKAGEGLVDKKTQQPLDLGFRFGKDGQGEVSVRRPDGVTCQGPVTGRMAGGKLGIQGNQSIPCNDGSSYGAPKIECQKEQSGQTQCYGVNADGSRYYMGMKRQ